MGSSLGILAAVAVIATTVATGRPIRWVGFLLVLGVPILVLGQLFTIGKGLANRERDGGSGGRRMSASHLIGGLPTWQGVLLGVTAFGGWLLAMTTWFGSMPTTTPGSCEAILSQGGIERCVDRADLDRYQAAGQRFAAGVLLAFFCIHLAAALATTARERASAPPGGTGSSF